ncbi:uncharacterized protein LOC116610192 [Nematostella vectensis]|uniref:uncharacterized protein LOC116610192 n=1 Tax=Nematostella vectensis TaxID=45351 RepID=UPI00139069A4|nr:uncharacterized protein LOC116610192 [Nematostella vectensis]
MIGLTNTTLKKVLGRASINLVTLQTVVMEIEAILNDRPLTYVSPDINDEDRLTSSHLLYGRSLPHPDTDADDLTDPSYGNDAHLRRDATRVALVIQHFWQRWKQEYLTSLRCFHGATGGSGETRIKIGDVVQIHSEKKRLNWKLGVVEDLIRGADGCVRAVTLKTAKGHTNRPISKLYPLEITTDVVEAADAQTGGQLRSNQPIRRSMRITAATRDRIADWARQLRAPPEDVSTHI